MARLVLVDTSDQLPGLLPVHGWAALMSSDLVVVRPDHPFIPHLDLADVRYQVVPEDPEGFRSLTGHDLLAGPSPAQKAQAQWIVGRARAEGEAAYLYGSGDREVFTRTLGMEAARGGVEVEVVYFALQPKGTTLLELVGVQERLREPGGCPWDAEQTHSSLMRYAVEEVYELAEAVAADDPDAIREELGDLLLQVVFHAQIAEDSADARPGASFTIDDVAQGITDKLVRRHPHVFADAAVSGAAEVMTNWEAFKAAEKPARSGPFDGVVAAQPALGYATELQARATASGLDPEDDARDARVRAELDAFLTAPDNRAREDRLGDLLLALVGLAHRGGIDPETALRGAARRFRERFETG